MIKLNKKIISSIIHINNEEGEFITFLDILDNI